MTLPLPSGTAIPAATQALVSILTTAFASQANVQVIFGPEPPLYVAPVTVLVSEVTGNQKPAELGPDYRREESFNIVCSVTTFSGDQDYAQRMTDAFNIFTQITPLIGNNPTLDPTGPGGTTPTVRWAQVGNFSGSPDMTAKGQSIYTLDFQVICVQRVRSLT